MMQFAGKERPSGRGCCPRPGFSRTGSWSRAVEFTSADACCQMAHDRSAREERFSSAGSIVMLGGLDDIVLRPVTRRGARRPAASCSSSWDKTAISSPRDVCTLAQVSRRQSAGAYRRSRDRAEPEALGRAAPRPPQVASGQSRRSACRWSPRECNTSPRRSEERSESHTTSILGSVCASWTVGGWRCSRSGGPQPAELLRQILQQGIQWPRCAACDSAPATAENWPSHSRDRRPRRGLFPRHGEAGP